MNKTEQLKKIIQEMVKKEVRNLLPIAVKEVMIGMISEAHVPLKDTKVIRESNRTPEEVPNLGNRVFDRNQLATMLGYGDVFEGRKTGSVTVDTVVTENGMVVPIDPNNIPDHVTSAFNKDYSALVKAWNK